MGPSVAGLAIVCKMPKKELALAFNWDKTLTKTNKIYDKIIQISGLSLFFKSEEFENAGF